MLTSQQIKTRGFLILIILFGIFTGVGVFTMDHAEGLSYLSSDPAACANCHIMQPQYDSWMMSGHHHVATCVDCHLPHDFVGKYLAKAENGYHHSKEFTLQNFHEPIMIKEKNARILQANCIECHEGLTHAMHPVADDPAQEVQCVHCHARVGHGPRGGTIGGPLRSIESLGDPL